jgi:hypothetical protein
MDVIERRDADELADAMVGAGGDDEMIVLWADGVRTLGTEIDRLRSALRDIATEANEGGIFHPGICADSEHRNAYVVQMAHAALQGADAR